MSAQSVDVTPPPFNSFRSPHYLDECHPSLKDSSSSSPSSSSRLRHESLSPGSGSGSGSGSSPGGRFGRRLRAMYSSGSRSDFQAAMKHSTHACSDILEEDSNVSNGLLSNCSSSGAAAAVRITGSGDVVVWSSGSGSAHSQSRAHSPRPSAVSVADTASQTTAEELECVCSSSSNFLQLPKCRGGCGSREEGAKGDQTGES